MLRWLFSLYRVDNVPWWLRPFFLALAYSVGYVQYFLLHRLTNLTARIEVEGNDPRTSDTPCIYAVWHSEVFAFFTAMVRIPNLAVINHPLWYMKGIHIMIELFGVEEIFLGSSGYGGKDAALKLTELLKDKKHNTIFNPDGPYGPIKEVKKGSFHVAAQTGLPIVSVHIEASPSIRIPTWDRKLIPLPFSKIKIRFSEPLYVTPEDAPFDTLVERFKQDLDGQSPISSPPPKSKN